MATQLNPDGTVTEFKIGQEEVEATATATQASSDSSKPLKLNKDGTPRKKMGPKKKFLNERKVLSGYIDANDWDSVVKEFGTPTNAITQLVERFKATKTVAKGETNEAQ